MNKITTVGIDLAKNVFSLHGVDGNGRVVLQRTVTRAKLVELVASLPPCLIGMEASMGAHDWARRFAQFGHTARLMVSKFVAPYRKGGKNDGNDAAAICEAVSRPTMRFVPVKSVEQQALLSLQRVRQGFVEERTATINRIRGLLMEFGAVLPQRSVQVRRGAAQLAETLPVLARRAIEDLLAHLRTLDERIEEYDRQLEQLARSNDAARRLMTINGVGPLTALAMVSTVGAAHEFKSARQFAAWLGLVPSQWSTGGKSRLGRITKRGDAYLRMLLVLGARVVLNTASRRDDRLSRWALALKARRGYYRAAVAIAAKNARIVWALLTREQTFQSKPAIAAAA
ncbi:MAG: IS110 family transposase [Salinibacterium sp.]|nr:MAG: IS110 family transposase [Salinibacterium sp.]